MLSAEDTDALCRVGPGTPMGELMRRYWLPVAYDWELEAGGQPQRMRLLGEDLIGWRNTDGVAAFTQERCPHRGASLYYGRVDGEGLRCNYHGWKFDTAGQCIDMPNERPESNFKHKVQITGYLGADYGNVVWIYMGPDQNNPPALPGFEWASVPAEQRRHYRKAVYECNWMQALEGEMDSTHVYYLHGRLRKEDPAKYGLYHADSTAIFHLRDKDWGLTYAAERHEPDGMNYWRTTQFMFPFYGMFPGSDDRVPLSIYVPIDDEHTLHMGIEWNPVRELPGPHWPAPTLPSEPGTLVEGMGPMKEEQKGRFFSKWWPVASPETDFLMDTDIKATKNNTGIPSVRLQDSAVIWSMGPIMDRTLEHLCTTDAAIIRVRKKLLAAARALLEDGTPPPGANDPGFYRLRTCNVALPPEIDWEEALSGWDEARTTDYPGVEYQQASKR